MSANPSNQNTEYFLHSYYNSFQMPEQFFSRLQHYKRLKWDASYFLYCWDYNIGTKLAGTIQRYMQLYHVQFCKGCSLQKIKNAVAANPETKVTLSFRKAQGLPAYVLVDFTSDTSPCSEEK